MLKAGLSAAESNGDYTAQNPTSTAAGKYQFTNYWMKAGGSSKSITAFAKRSQGVYEVPTSLEDFKKNPDLQEAYFDFYSREVLWKDAKSLSKGDNPLNLDMVSLGAAIHYQGYPSARKQVRSGKLNKATVAGVDGAQNNNQGVADYIEKVNKNAASAGFKPLNSADVATVAYSSSSSNGAKKIEPNKTDPKVPGVISGVPPEETTNVPNEPKSSIEARAYKQSVYDEYEAKGRVIDDLHPNNYGLAQKKRKELTQLYIDNGKADIVNEVVEAKNLETSQERIAAIGRFNELKELATKIDVGTGNPYSTKNYKKDREQDLSKIQTKQGLYTISKEQDQRYVDRLRKQGIVYGKRYDKGLASGKHANVDLKKLEQELKKEYKFLTGEDINLEVGGGNVTLRGVGDFDLKSGLKGFNDDGTPGNPQEIAKIIIDKNFSFNANKGAVQTIDKSAYEPAMSVADREAIYAEQVANNAKGEAERRDAVAAAANPNDTTKEKGLLETTDAKNKNAAADSVRDKIDKLDVSMKGKDLNIGDTKREFPIDGILGAGMVLAGNAMASSAKIPMRDETISRALTNMNAELKAKSKEGLPVEVEAMMKNKLADSYQQGLQTIRNNSGGDRAKILGNVGMLENAKNLGLINIQMADYEAKERAFDKYMESEKYINDFESNKKIANHAIRYENAAQKKAEGKAVAAAGFDKIIGEIQYQKENGPGSANAMYKSLMFQQMFNFDPTAKDDGSGTVKGTKSYRDAEYARMESEKINFMGVLNEMSKLPEDQQASLNESSRNGATADQMAVLIQGFKKTNSEPQDQAAVSNDNVTARNREVQNEIPLPSIMPEGAVITPEKAEAAIQGDKTAIAEIKDAKEQKELAQGIVNPETRAAIEAGDAAKAKMNKALEGNTNGMFIDPLKGQAPEKEKVANGLLPTPQKEMLTNGMLTPSSITARGDESLSEADRQAKNRADYDAARNQNKPILSEEQEDDPLVLYPADKGENEEDRKQGLLSNY
jgi:hypothetical protein